MYEKEVKAGALYLDENHPGWADRIDLKTLDLSQYDNCVLGQVLGPHKSRELCGTFALPWALAHGFTLPCASQFTSGWWSKLMGEWQFKRLTTAWKAEIKARRAAQRVMQEAEDRMAPQRTRTPKPVA